MPTKQATKKKAVTKKAAPRLRKVATFHPPIDADLLVQLLNELGEYRYGTQRVSYEITIDNSTLEVWKKG